MFTSKKSLLEKSTQALAVFVKVKNDLLSINNEIKEQETILESKIEQMKTEKGALLAQSRINSGIIEKINHLTN